MNTKRCGFHIYSTTSHSTHLRDENGKQICQNCPSRLGPKPTPPQGVPALGRRPIAVGVPSMKTGLSFTPGRQSRTSRNTWWRSCCSRRRRCATSPPPPFGCVHLNGVTFLHVFLVPKWSRSPCWRIGAETQLSPAAGLVFVLGWGCVSLLPTLVSHFVPPPRQRRQRPRSRLML